jgi:glycosyltransferase involved in cell wall biosynthesis
VIVDNRSTDRSGAIARSYAEQDSRIRVHENAEFVSAIPNWNNAVRQMSPEAKYCKVVHADDWMFPRCLAAMVEVAEAHPSVGLVSSYRLNEARVDLDGLPFPSACSPGREIARRTLLRHPLYLFGSPTSVLVRADLVRKRDPFYNEASIHADSEVCLDILQDSDFGFSHEVLTYTRRHNEAMTSFLSRMETHRSGKLICLRRYGPAFLDASEFAARIEQVGVSYHKFLADAFFERRGKEFLEYHKKTLAENGIAYSRFQVFVHACLGAIERMAHPRAVVRSLLKRDDSHGQEREDAKKLTGVTD